RDHDAIVNWRNEILEATAAGTIVTGALDSGCANADFLRIWTSQVSGSNAMTRPLRPARAAAANVNRPTFAPISHTTSFGRIRSMTFLSNIGSTFVIGRNRYLSPAEGVTKMGMLPKELGRRRV